MTPRPPATDLRTIARDHADADNARRRLADAAPADDRDRFLTMTASEARAELVARGLPLQGRSVRDAPMVHVHLYMPPALRKRLDRAADHRGVSLSDYIRAAVEAAVNRDAP